MERAEPNSQLRIETPKGRTYGECVMDEIASIKMINGEFRATLHIKDKPKRLSHEEALSYYTNKLRNVWANVEKLD